MEIDSIDYLKFVFALLFVIGLIGAIALLAKKIGMGNRGPMHYSRKKRLSIVETMQLDSKRRVILIRRENKDHLILLGGMTDLVIENDIPVNFDIEENSEPPVKFLSRLRKRSIEENTSQK